LAKFLSQRNSQKHQSNTNTKKVKGHITKDRRVKKLMRESNLAKLTSLVSSLFLLLPETTSFSLCRFSKCVKRKNENAMKKYMSIANIAEPLSSKQ